MMVKNMLNKEECEKALDRICRLFRTSIQVQEMYYDINGNNVSIDEDTNIILQLIKEHFELVEKYALNCEFISEQHRVITRTFSYLEKYMNPQPYKFEELKKGMWVWIVWFEEGVEKGEFAKILNTYTIPPYYHNDKDGEEHERVEFRIGDGHGTIDFDAWKFYPPTKALEYQK